jgi:hypothetical protein
MNVEKTLKLGTNYVKGKTYSWAVGGINNGDASSLRKWAAGRVKKDLTDAGVDVDRLFGGQKGDLIRKALSGYAGGMVKGGKTKAELDMSNIVIKGTRED